VCAKTGEGKTTLLFDISTQLYFTKVIVVAKDLREELYDTIRVHYETVSGEDSIYMTDDVAEMPMLDELNDDDYTLYIIDDCLTEEKKHQDLIREIFLRGRKRKVIIVYIAQGYFEVPLLIRNNANYFFFKRFLDERLVARIGSVLGSGMTKQQWMAMYRESTRTQDDFLMIDVDAVNPLYRYRKRVYQRLRTWPPSSVQMFVSASEKEIVDKRSIRVDVDGDGDSSDDDDDYHGGGFEDSTSYHAFPPVLVFNSRDEVLEKLKLYTSAIQAGNDSVMVQNVAESLVDLAERKRYISQQVANRVRMRIRRRL
jgi:hypothetical protein